MYPSESVSATDTASPLPRSNLLPDPRHIKREYEKLIREWTDELFNARPETSSQSFEYSQMDNQYLRFAWMRLIDRHLEQQWEDSQHMLQCAQAWYRRSSLSLAEVVHTMNILSLRSMQQSLDARQELLHTLASRSSALPQFPSFSMHTPPSTVFGRPIPQESKEVYEEEGQQQSSILSEEQDEMHAPLLRRHHTNVINRPITFDAVVASSASMDTSPHTCNGIEPCAISTAARPSRLTPSPSTPTFSTSHDTVVCQNGFVPACNHNRYYEKLSVETKRKDTCRSRTNSSSSTGDDVENKPWESWFTKSGQTNYCCFFCKNPLPVKSLSADEADIPMMRTDDSTSGSSEAKFKEYEASLLSNEKAPIGKSESSISTFRPISKNLAPRCAPPPKRSSSSSYTRSRSSWQENQPTITKSRSFPSKVAALGKPKHSPPLPTKTHKERNFVMQSIVNKKASLSKLFSSKKSVAGSN
ncbi:hypothetical protein DFQ28_004204 [Apophysomyces sp. BC1034]|nr:hypothetical protein DFQ30_004252 [Apophysomyces sp. BC1015]KAG0178497.1 hypothetical protein DFQ29_003405 [Apophysomyces sp. BC1021]KAG0188894.1 hypothetical protein DFQ28_004204 [Apophysomyces sp. BC1034]